MRLGRKANAVSRAALALCAWLIVATLAEPGDSCPDLAAATAPSPPEAPSCANERLTSYDALLVLAPHPDDEVLAFAGLIDAYVRQGKDVQIVVATDGDAYCEACLFWKNGSVKGVPCDAMDLSNFATPRVDSFAEIRREESAAAVSILGAGTPAFLGYPDTGLASAWERLEKGEIDANLRRSDFSQCDACGSCGAGYGAGPETPLTAQTLLDQLTRRIEGTSPRTLIATSHWLDGHGDHAALGHFVRRVNSHLAAPRPAVFAVIHAHTPKSASHPDCWHPGPAAPLCACALEECAQANPGWIAASRAYRFRPTWPTPPPDDTDYGAPLSLCLAEDLYEGPHPRKLRAVEAYGSQLGYLTRGAPFPEPLRGILDCSGYLVSFVRRTELFFLPEPGDDTKAPDGDHSP